MNNEHFGNLNNSKAEDGIDIRKLLKRFFEFWPYFILSGLIALIGAYFFNRYYTPVYKATSTVLIKDDRKGMISNNTFMQNLDMFQSNQSIQNEIAVLQSYSLNKKTVEENNLYIQYFKLKSYRRKDELYKATPFYIITDTTEYQAINIPVTVEMIEGGIKINYSINEAYDVIHYGKWKARKITPDKSIKVSSEVKFFETYSDNCFTFRVIPVPDKSEEVKIGDKYEFVLNDPEVAVDAYRRNLKIEPINKDATIVLISLTDHLIQRAIDYLNMLTTSYINMGLNEKNQIAIKTMEFIDGQLAGITDTLSQIEIQLENFRTQNKVTDISYQGQAIFQKLQNLEYEKSIEQLKVGYYNYLLNYVQSDNAGKDIIAPSAIGIDDALLNELIRELSQLYVAKEQLGLSVSKTNPYFIELEVKISSLKKSLVENVTNINTNAKYNLASKEKDLEKLQRELATLPKTERELISINRMFTVNDQIYTFLLEKRAEAAIAKASTISDNKIIDSARIDSKIKPKTKQNYIIALILGLLIPALIVLLVDSVKNTVNDLSEIESLTSVPIVGNIIHYEDTQENALENPDAAILESFRAIRTNLDFFIPNKEKKIITVTSMTSGEGKSFCSFHLAIVFALAKKKTLLIGADIRKPDVGKFFNVKLEKGLSNYLINSCTWEDIVIKSGIKDLDFIPAGPVPPNPAELLSPDQINRILENLGEYDIVIFDTSPVGIFADAAYIIKFSDMVLYVSRYNYSKKNEFRNMNDIIEKLGIKHSGLLCNDLQKKGSKYYYNKYYYYNRNYNKKK